MAVLILNHEVFTRVHRTGFLITGELSLISPQKILPRIRKPPGGAIYSRGSPPTTPPKGNE
jgi:hypothetical protein